MEEGRDGRRETKHGGTRSVIKIGRATTEVEDNKAKTEVEDNTAKTEVEDNTGELFHRGQRKLALTLRTTRASSSIIAGDERDPCRRSNATPVGPRDSVSGRMFSSDSGFR